MSGLFALSLPALIALTTCATVLIADVLTAALETPPAGNAGADLNRLKSA